MPNGVGDMLMENFTKSVTWAKIYSCLSLL